MHDYIKLFLPCFDMELYLKNSCYFKHLLRFPESLNSQYRFKDSENLKKLIASCEQAKIRFSSTSLLEHLENLIIASSKDAELV